MSIACICSVGKTASGQNFHAAFKLPGQSPGNQLEDVVGATDQTMDTLASCGVQVAEFPSLLEGKISLRVCEMCVY